MKQYFKKVLHSSGKRDNLVLGRNFTTTWSDESFWWLGLKIWNSLPGKDARVTPYNLFKLFNYNNT